MRALAFADFGRVEVVDVPKPEIQEDTDVIVRVTTTAICGSDLHIVHGRIPGMTPGSTLGHEFTGVVEHAGGAVKKFAAGDRVLASFIVPCGECWYCERKLFNRCPELRVFGYGAFFGDLSGGQAEYVRVPNADICLHSLTGDLSDEQALFAGDIFSTAYDGAAIANIQPGDSVVVQGCGPVGLMALQVVKSFSPSVVYAIDTVADRLQMAEKFGARPVDANSVHVPSFIQDETGGRGADVLLECVGAIPALIGAIDIIRPGGCISVIGVYSEPEIELPLNVSFVKGIDIKFCGTANVVGRWDATLGLIGRGEAHPDQIISHRLNLSDAVQGYALFEAREALKVVLTP
jgi:threonine dehydrogenase-like Zn-dependent dehydrogenase